MTFNRNAALLCISSAMLLGLAGCPGQDENSVQPAMTVHMHEVHMEERNPAAVRVAPNRAMVAITAPAATGGYDYTNLERDRKSVV